MSIDVERGRGWPWTLLVLSLVVGLPAGLSCLREQADVEALARAMAQRDAGRAAALLTDLGALPTELHAVGARWLAELERHEEPASACALARVVLRSTTSSELLPMAATAREQLAARLLMAGERVLAERCLESVAMRGNHAGATLLAAASPSAR